MHSVLSDSEFHMWRAVFAFSLADNLLSLEEQGMLRSYVRSVPFSPAQLAILKNDFNKPQNVEAMYKKITDPEHKQRFCMLARALAWCEGDMDEQEEKILRRVSCLAHGEDNRIFRESRTHPGLHDVYQAYMKMETMRPAAQRPGFQIQV